MHDRYPDVVDRQRLRLEAVVGQPIPAQLNEVCDVALPSLFHFLQARSGRRTPLQTSVNIQFGGRREDDASKRE